MIPTDQLKKDSRPWENNEPALKNVKVSTHQHPFPEQTIRNTGWACDGRTLFP
jgi:hypothetical protein